MCCLVLLRGLFAQNLRRCSPTEQMLRLRVATRREMDEGAS